MTQWLQPLDLVGRAVTLEPLTRSHHDGLVEATRDGELWKLWYTSVPSPEGMAAEIDRRLGLQQQGSMLPFVVRVNGTGQVGGMTTYLHADAPNRHIEIGATWYRATLQRTGLNSECKWLLLRHAFESLQCVAVEFRTHVLNRPSRRAIERIGAKQDGILRNHMLLPDGTLRDTCVYSIIAAEWPTVRAHLQALLERPGISQMSDSRTRARS